MLLMMRWTTRTRKPQDGSWCPGLTAGKAQIWPSTGAGHLGQSSLHDTSHLVLWLSLLKVAGHLLDVLGEGGDVDPLPRLRDGMSSQLEVPENSD